MTIKIHDLKPADGANKRKKRVGRGIAGKGGKTAGRGTKGQKAKRTIPATFEGGQMPLHMRLPKRGFNNIFAKDYAEVNLGAVQKALDGGKLDAKGTIDHAALKAAGLARGGKDGVRLLGKGTISAKLAFRVAGVSAGARQAVEAAGGSVEVIEVVPASEKAAARKGQAKAKAKAEA